MVKFDIDGFKFLLREHFRVLTAIEMGMKNHDLVPTPLIETISQMKRGNCFKVISDLHKNKLIVHDSKPYDGYRLTFRGYDYLAIHTLVQRGLIIGVGRQIGVGKESDVFEAISSEDSNTTYVLKLHRLGRISFRKIKEKRDYLGKRKSASWLYLSRLSALKEFAFMKILSDKKFPVPTAIDVSRHAVLMTKIPGYCLYHVAKIRKPAILYNKCMQLLVQLAEHGLIHCDFNEFNLMVDNDYNLTLIDFPQMISIHHPNAIELFNRDVQCIRDFFGRKHDYSCEYYPVIDKAFLKEQVHTHLDTIVQASGFFSPQENEDYAKLIEEYKSNLKDHDTLDQQSNSPEDEEEDEEEEEEDDDEEEKVEKENNENSNDAENTKEIKKENIEQTNVTTNTNAHDTCVATANGHDANHTVSVDANQRDDKTLDANTHSQKDKENENESESESEHEDESENENENESESENESETGSDSESDSKGNDNEDELRKKTQEKEQWKRNKSEKRKAFEQRRKLKKQFAAQKEKMLEEHHMSGDKKNDIDDNYDKDNDKMMSAEEIKRRVKKKRKATNAQSTTKKGQKNREQK